SNIQGISTDISSMFANLSTEKSDTTASSSFLFDYASIKNGSYGKLVKAYYAKNSDTAKNTEEIKTENKNNSQVKGDADALKSAADELVASGSKSVFNQTDIKGEDGVTKKGYDYDAIYKSVKKFADKYNDLVGSAGNSESDAVLSRTLSMIKNTSKNENLLGKVGITIGEDNKLTVDEKKLKAASINDLKALFSGAGSYAYSISSSASLIADKAANELAKANSYSANGTYSYSKEVGNLYDGTI
ncbi:MAG: hypothetical protein GX567_11430, partial [Clostridia bacterium]|nr:hypothetical protein [Clostridia bacterium]